MGLEGSVGGNNVGTQLALGQQQLRALTADTSACFLCTSFLSLFLSFLLPLFLSF